MTSHSSSYGYPRQTFRSSRGNSIPTEIHCKNIPQWDGDASSHDTLPKFQHTAFHAHWIDIAVLRTV